MPLGMSFTFQFVRTPDPTIPPPLPQSMQPPNVLGVLANKLLLIFSDFDFWQCFLQARVVVTAAVILPPTCDPPPHFTPTRRHWLGIFIIIGFSGFIRHGFLFHFCTCHCFFDFVFFLFLSLHTYIHTWGKELVYEKEKKGRRGMASKSDFWVTNCFQILTGAALICVNGINLHKSINCLFALPLFPRSYFFITTPLCKFANWPEKETREQFKSHF